MELLLPPKLYWTPLHTLHKHPYRSCKWPFKHPLAGSCGARVAQFKHNKRVKWENLACSVLVSFHNTKYQLMHGMKGVACVGVCEWPPEAFPALQGQRRGEPLSNRKVSRFCERIGTVWYLLRRDFPGVLKELIFQTPLTTYSQQLSIESENSRLLLAIWLSQWH